MADKTIGSLPQATELDEESLLVTEQLGEARSVTGALLADYAKAAAQQEAQKAGEYAQSAGESATAAAQKAQEAQNVATKPPYIQGENWWVWDEESGAYVDSGVDASVSLAIADTVTGAPGSDAMVENIGTASDLLLRFTIPRGEKGEVGSVNSVNEKTGDVTLQAQDIPTAAPQDVSAWTDTQAYLDGLHAQSKALEDSKAQPGGIATLNSSGKLEQMPTAADVGAVPTSRTVNGHALTGNVTVTPNDIFKQYTVVPNGTNFNTLRSPGLYMQTSNDKTTNNVNSPVTGSAFVMLVFNDTVDKVGWQIFYGYRGRKVFVRGWDLWTDTYEPWRQICTTTGAGEIYPVGAVYISYTSTDPASLFGGTWAAITGRFPYFNAGTTTGGSNTHTLATGQIPKNKVYSSVPINGNAGLSNSLHTDAFTAGFEYCDFELTYMGNGEAHNNMPAYQTLYAWRRTA